MFLLPILDVSRYEYSRNVRIILIVSKTHIKSYRNEQRILIKIKKKKLRKQEK